MIKPIILCGGKGSRLWPLSRKYYPKQFLSLEKGRSLLQHTLLRTETLELPRPPMIVCNNEYRFLVADQLRQLDMDGEIVLEPEGRNTAPAAASAALLADPDDLLFFMPADHVIEDGAALRDALNRATPLAREGMLVTFGIRPTAPETGFGYIQRGEPCGQGFAVRRFVEKPDRETVTRYMASGDHFWNSGMLLAKASTFLEEMRRHAPDILDVCREAVDKRYVDMDFIRLEESAFARCRAQSIDYAVLEKTANCAMAVLQAEWRDVGTWTALYDLNEKDGDGNVRQGDVHCQDVSGSYLRSESQLLVAFGVDDLIVVQTKDATLVSSRDRAAELQQVYSQLELVDRPETLMHPKVYRPWGTFEGMDRGERFQVKRITVYPGQVLSLQKHAHRAEHWVVVRGTATVTLGEQKLLLTEDQSTYIPPGTLHRLANESEDPLEIIEVQTGGYLGEDDIERLEDVYGRRRPQD